MSSFEYSFGFEFHTDTHLEHTDAATPPATPDYMAVATPYANQLERWTLRQLRPLARALTRDYAEMRRQVERAASRSDQDPTDPAVRVGLFLEDWDEAVDASRPLHERNYRKLEIQSAAGFANQSISVQGVKPEKASSFTVMNAVLVSLEKMRGIGPSTAMEMLKVISEGHEKGYSAKRVGELLEERVGIEGRRARFVARNEMGNANAALARAQQTENGITHYIWRTSKDERVVGTPGGKWPTGSAGHMNHFERDGQTFKWSSPPFDGHPGEAYNCRCVAEPVFGDEPEEELEAEQIAQPDLGAREEDPPADLVGVHQAAPAGRISAIDNLERIKRGERGQRLQAQYGTGGRDYFPSNNAVVAFVDERRKNELQRFPVLGELNERVQQRLDALDDVIAANRRDQDALRTQMRDLPRGIVEIARGEARELVLPRDKSDIAMWWSFETGQDFLDIDEDDDELMEQAARAILAKRNGIRDDLNTLLERDIELRKDRKDIPAEFEGEMVAFLQDLAAGTENNDGADLELGRYRKADGRLRAKGQQPRNSDRWDPQGSINFDTDKVEAEGQTMADMFGDAFEFQGASKDLRVTRTKARAYHMSRQAGWTQDSYINLGDGFDVGAVADAHNHGILMHEMGHWLEDHNPVLDEAAKRYLLIKADQNGGNPKNKGTAWSSRERVFEDTFKNDYAAKIYLKTGRARATQRATDFQWEELRATEITSMAVQHFIDPASAVKLLNDDPDLFWWAVSVSRGDFR